MTTLACFGDSWGSQSVPYLEALGAAEGFSVDTTLVDPSLSAQGWLQEGQQRIRQAAAALPPDSLWYASVGGVDALGGTPGYVIAPVLNQLIELLGHAGQLPIYHFGYEWFPEGPANEALEHYYRAVKRLDREHCGYHFAEMRAVLFAPTFVDELHMSPIDYEDRVRHAWECHLRYVV